MRDQTIDLYDLEPAMSDIVSQCEITGMRTRIRRGNQVVAMLITADEYTALTETLSISNDAALMAKIEDARSEASQGGLLEAEDLFVE